MVLDVGMCPNIYILNVDGDIDMGGFCVLILGPFSGPEDAEKYYKEQVFYDGDNEYISISAGAIYLKDIALSEGWYLVLDAATVAPLTKLKPGKHWESYTEWLNRWLKNRPNLIKPVR